MYVACGNLRGLASFLLIGWRAPSVSWRLGDDIRSLNRSNDILHKYRFCGGCYLNSLWFHIARNSVLLKFLSQIMIRYQASPTMPRGSRQLSFFYFFTLPTNNLRSRGRCEAGAKREHWCIIILRRGSCKLHNGSIKRKHIRFNIFVLEPTLNVNERRTNSISHYDSKK